MKRVKIITFHSAENSGAVLQCYALQEVIKKLGGKVQIIDYQPTYMKEQYKIFVNPFESKKNGSRIKSFAAYTLQNIRFRRKWRRKNEFKNFRRTYLEMTKEYTSIMELNQDSPEADIYICGSDQIWNSSLTGGELDPAYFLQFGNEKIKRYSYAISVGKELTECDMENIFKMASNIEKISFREESVCHKFKYQFPNEKFYQCIDPTLLLDFRDWKKFVHTINEKGKYILVYALEKNEAFQKELDYILTKKPGLKILDISQCNLNLKGKVKRMMGFSPESFLSYIYNAEYIVTNSFHCTVFSAIFEKKFVTIQHTRSNSRLSNLLVGLGIENRFYSDNSDVIFEGLDYDMIKEKLEVFRKGSIQYLEQILEN